MNTNTHGDFRICISVPLNIKTLSDHTIKKQHIALKNEYSKFLKMKVSENLLLDLKRRNFFDRIEQIEMK